MPEQQQTNQPEQPLPDGSKEIKDPELIKKVADRVYELMREELRVERERRGGS